MKKIRKIIVITVMILTLFNIKVLAHGGNITGWKDKNSSEIIKHEENYYGYHKQNGVRHYHQVKWNEEKQKWEITKTAVYYDEKFNILNTIHESEEKLPVRYNQSVDGDTAKFEIDGKIITVRFLGIDTPETVHPNQEEQPYGKEASNFTKEKLKNANKIELEYDSNSSKTDKYERHLAWIWVDNSLLQEELIGNGLAKIYMLQDNYRYAWLLQEKQEKAQERKIGIWNTEIEDSTNIVKDNQKAYEVIIRVIIIIALIGITILIRKRVWNKQD